MPLIIGLTGAIATGKSTASEVMVRLGAAHSDADKLVHSLYEPGTRAFDRIVDIFGSEVVGQNGYIDRKILGSKVFGKPEEMQKLTSAIGNINEAVKKAIDTWRYSMGKNEVAVIEAVNLIEAGYGRWCDHVWLVACEEETARKRLIERNNLTLEEANQRLESQRPWEQREPASDVVFFNDRDENWLVSRIRDEFTRVTRLWREGKLPPSKYHEWWEARQQSEAQSSAQP